MKKLLALVLALVMTLGLATVGTNAAYKDADSINYKEAVDVMSAIGVLAGDETGFRPTDTLKRSEGAKIVAYLMLGNKTAEAIQASGNKFTDVPANHWAAGYIEYLTSAGVIGGVGGGKFEPDSTLTANQFAKMLLCALGYDAKIEGLGGDDWAINTQKLANQAGLFSGNKDVVGSAAVTREEAALYAFNTICAPLVQYETKGTTITIGDASVQTGASNWAYKTDTVRKNQTIYQNYLNAGATNSPYIVEFAEEYYAKLVLDEGNDSFNRPANTWTFEGKKVGTYTDDYDELYTKGTTYGTIYKDLGLTKATTVSEYYVNGVKQNPIILTKDSVDEVGDNGVETYVYYFTNGTVQINEVYWYVGDVAAAYAATASKEAYVVINGRNNGKNGNFETTDFALEDVVLYQYSDKANDTGVKKVEKASTVSGTLTSYVEGKQATVGGTVYEYSKTIQNQASSSLLSKGVDVDVVLDKYGYAIDVDDAGVRNYAVILNIATNAGDFNSTAKVELLLSDGSKSGAVSLANDKADVGEGENKLEKGDIVKFSINSSGKYVLEEVSSVQTIAQIAANYGKEVIENGKYSIGAFLSNANGVSGIANGKTVFLVKDSGGNYKAYTGIKNAPTIVTKSPMDADMIVNSYGEAGKDAAAVLVYIDAEKQAIVQTNDVVFVGVKKSTRASNDEKLGTYWEFDAITNGVPGKIKIDDASVEANITTGEDGFYLFDNVSYNANGIASISANSGNVHGNEGNRIVGTDIEKNGTITLAGKAYSYASDVKVFYINKNNETSVATVKGIAKDTNDLVWFKVNTDNDVSYIFIKEDGSVAGAATPAAASVAYTWSDDDGGTADVVNNVGVILAYKEATTADAGEIRSSLLLASDAKAADVVYPTLPTGWTRVTSSTSIPAGATVRLYFFDTTNGALWLGLAVNYTMGAGATKYRAEDLAGNGYIEIANVTGKLSFALAADSVGVLDEDTPAPTGDGYALTISGALNDANTEVWISGTTKLTADSESANGKVYYIPANSEVWVVDKDHDEFTANNVVMLDGALLGVVDDTSVTANNATTLKFKMPAKAVLLNADSDVAAVAVTVGDDVTLVKADASGQTTGKTPLGTSADGKTSYFAASDNIQDIFVYTTNANHAIAFPVSTRVQGTGGGTAAEGKAVDATKGATGGVKIALDDVLDTAGTGVYGANVYIFAASKVTLTNANANYVDAAHSTGAAQSNDYVVVGTTLDTLTATSGSAVIETAVSGKVVANSALTTYKVTKDDFTLKGAAALTVEAGTKITVGGTTYKNNTYYVDVVATVTPALDDSLATALGTSVIALTDDIYVKAALATATTYTADTTFAPAVAIARTTNTSTIQYKAGDTWYEGAAAANSTVYAKANSTIRVIGPAAHPAVAFTYTTANSGGAFPTANIRLVSTLATGNVYEVTLDADNITASSEA